MKKIGRGVHVARLRHRYETREGTRSGQRDRTSVCKESVPQGSSGVRYAHVVKAGYGERAHDLMAMSCSRFSSGWIGLYTTAQLKTNNKHDAIFD